jgi:hypothetical protein
MWLNYKYNKIIVINTEVNITSVQGSRFKVQGSRIPGKMTCSIG